MNRQTFLPLLFVLCLWVSCGNRPAPEELAGKAAKDYYDRLVAGDYEAFLCGRAGADSLPADYRRQLLKAYEHYIRKQEKLHGGIVEVTFSNAKSDTLQHIVQAFLHLTFRDSLKEEIVVPMTEHNGRWYMK